MKSPTPRTTDRPFAFHCNNGEAAMRNGIPVEAPKGQMALKVING